MCVPRDHHSDAEQALETLLERTPIAHRLVYVVGRAPSETTAYLRRRSDEAGFTLIERDEWLVPNHSRNLAMEDIDSEYVAFVDNDVIVDVGWLEALVGCADETGAALVGPLQLIGPISEGRIHLAGGHIEEGERRSGLPRTIRVQPHLQSRRVSDIEDELIRSECDFAEFHCQLARTSALREIGPFDERLLTIREVEDEAFRIRDHGGTVWFEPTARAAFLPPTRASRVDRAFLAHRWGERANRQSFEYFCAKHGIDRRHIDETIPFANRMLRQAPLFSWFRRPVRRVLNPLGLGRVESAVARVLFAVEALLNRLLIRPGTTTL